MRHSDFVTEARQRARELWEAYCELKSMQAEWNAQDYSNTLGVGESDAFAGANEDLDAVKVGAVIFAAADAIETIMDAGHATNVTNLL